MPYAIVPMIPHPASRHPRVRNTWVGWDKEDGWNLVRLRRGRALIWHPTVTLTDPRAVVLGDNGLDVLSASRRRLVADLAPDRTLRAGLRLRDLIADLLRNPVPGTVPPLRPRRNGRYEILCGPGPVGENRLWEQATEPDGPHSQYIQDSFNRADSGLDGSTSSDGLFTWSVAVGNPSLANIVSNVLKLTRSGADEFFVLAPSQLMDTDDHYAQVGIVEMYWPAAASLLTVELSIRSNYPAGYTLHIGRTGASSGYREVYDDQDGVTLASDSVLTSSGTIYFSMDGSTYTAKVDGSTVLSGTDPTTTGEFLATLNGYVAGSDDTPFVRVDAFVAADLAAALEQEGYRWRNDDGSESGATWAASQDAAATIAKNTNTRLRTLLNATGDPAGKSYQAEYRKSGSTQWHVLGVD